MAIDWDKPIFITAVAQGDRLAILGGSNDEEAVRTLHALMPSSRLLVAHLEPEREDAANDGRES